MLTKKGQEILETRLDESEKERKATQKEIADLKKSLEEEKAFRMKYLELCQMHSEKVEGIVQAQQLVVTFQKVAKDVQKHMATVAENEMATVKLNHQVEIQAEAFKAKSAKIEVTVMKWLMENLDEILS